MGTTYAASVISDDTEENREALRLRRFHSLVRLLSMPQPMHLAPVEVQEHKSTYQPVVDVGTMNAEP